MPRLTKRIVDAIPAAQAGIVWDDALKGFGVKTLAGGGRTYVVNYRNASGRERRMSLGRHGVLTVDEAREKAKQMLARVANGEDPQAERQSARVAPHVTDLLDRYIAEHVKVHNAATTLTGVLLIVEKHLRPRLGALKVASVTRQDILALHLAMSKTARAANLALSILSKVFNLAELWGLRPENSNPCKRVPRYKLVHRERFLTTDELARLGMALDQAASGGIPWQKPEGDPSKHLPKEENRRSPVNPQVLAILRVLIFTGARLSEVLELQWQHVDIGRGTLALPVRKGGLRRAHPVSTMALAIIAGQPVAGLSPWVFASPHRPDSHVSVSVLENTWQRIRALAGLDDVHIHDLRHTVGTYASQGGVNAFLVRDLLRHETTAMTNRYANRAEDPIRAISEQVGLRIEAGLAGGKAVK